MFVTCAKNAEDAHARNYVFLSPNGDRVDVYGLTRFCKNNGLTHSAMSLVNSGKATHHKGWTKP